MLAPDKKKFLLQQACERAHIDWAEICEAASIGTAQIHETDNGVAITSIITSGPWKILLVMAMGGNDQGLLELSEKIEQFGANGGCNIIRTEGRHGFELKKQRHNKLYEAAMAGYKPVAIVYEKIIQEPRNVVTEASPGNNRPDTEG